MSPHSILDKVEGGLHGRLREPVSTRNKETAKRYAPLTKIAAAAACTAAACTAAACMHFAWAAAEPDRIQIPFQKHWRRGARSWTASTQRSWPAFSLAPSDQRAQL